MSFPQFGIAYPPPSVTTASPQVLMSTASPPSTTSSASGGAPSGAPGSSSTPCCDTGRPIMTDPHTGQTICSCQYTPGAAGGLLATYPRVPGLPEGLAFPGSPYAAAAAAAGAGFMPLATDPSAFYPAMGAYDLKALATSAPMYAYDPALGAYPYANGFLDPNARRKNATRESTQTLKAWLAEHKKNPYPTKGEKIMLAIITKMTLTQVSTWFANARRRLKKENKMTWEPRNRVDDEDDDDKMGDSDNEDHLGQDKSGEDRVLMDDDKDDLEEIDIGTESDDDLNNKDQLSDSRRLMEKLAAQSMAASAHAAHLQSLAAHAAAASSTSPASAAVGSVITSSSHNPLLVPPPFPRTSSPASSTAVSSTPRGPNEGGVSPASSPGLLTPRDTSAPAHGPGALDSSVGSRSSPGLASPLSQHQHRGSDSSDNKDSSSSKSDNVVGHNNNNDSRSSPSSTPAQTVKPKIWSMADIASSSSSSSSHHERSSSPSPRRSSLVHPPPGPIRGAIHGFPGGYTWPGTPAGLPHPYALPPHLLPSTSLASAAAALQQATSTAAILSRYGLGTSSAFSRPPGPGLVPTGIPAAALAGPGAVERRDLPSSLKSPPSPVGHDREPGSGPTLHTAFRPVPKSKPSQPIHV